MRRNSDIFLRLYVAILFLLLSFSGFAQISVTRFETNLYGPVGKIFTEDRLIPAKDTGLFILGRISSEYHHAVITRLDKSGNLLWSNSYSLTTDSFIEMYSIINTYDNGLIISGNIAKRVQLSGVTYTPGILKIDAGGNVLWSKKYPSIGNGWIPSVTELADSSVLVNLSYYSGSNYFSVLQKIDQNGNIQWSKKGQNFMNAKEKSNKNILTYAMGNKITIKEYDANGNDVSEKQYYSPGLGFNGWVGDLNNQNESAVICDLIDSVASWTNGFYVLKTDASGNVNFSNNYNFTGTNTTIYQTYAGGFSKDCGIYSNTRHKTLPTNNEFSGILKLDYAGNCLWHKIYNPNLYVYSEYVVNMPDNGYALLGEVSNGGAYSRVIKTDKSGNTSCSNYSLTNIIKTNIPLSINPTLHSSTFVTISNANMNIAKTSNPLTVTVCSETFFPTKEFLCDSTIILNEPKGVSLNSKIFKIYPNPSKGKFYFEVSNDIKYNFVEVYNSLGEKITEDLQITENTIDLTLLPNGIYLIRIESDKRIGFLKVIKE